MTGDPERGSTEATARQRASSDRPRLIVDFEVDDDALFVAVRNIGEEPAGSVRVTFAPSFRGLGGTVDIPRLALFKHLAFLAPGRTIRAFVDSIDAYLRRTDPAEPRSIRVAIRYRDAAGHRYRTRIRHDLRIWEDLPRPGRRNSNG